MIKKQIIYIAIIAIAVLIIISVSYALTHKKTGIWVYSDGNKYHIEATDARFSNMLDLIQTLFTHSSNVLLEGISASTIAVLLLNWHCHRNII